MYIVARVHYYPPAWCAGAEMMLHSMLRALSERGHRVEVYMSRINSQRDPYILDGIKVYPQRSRHDYAGAVSSCDVLVTHLENTPPAVSTAMKYKKPLVQVMHNDHAESKMYANLKADLIVFNSAWMRDSFGGHPNELIIPPPIIQDDYRTTPGHAVTLINLCDIKGEKVFWEMVSRMPDVEFLGVKGAYSKQVVHDLPNVEIVPHGRRMRDVYAMTKLLLMPSKYESWGRVATEAMVSGIPVIASPTPGLKENLGTAGTFVEHDDLDGWEREIRRLLKPQAWNKASKAALKRAQELDPADDLNRWVDAVEAL